MNTTGTWMSSGWAGSPNARWIWTGHSARLRTAAAAMTTRCGARDSREAGIAVKREDSHMHGDIAHVAINAGDVDTSLRFYAALFGWEFGEYAPGFHRASLPGGGIAA